MGRRTIIAGNWKMNNTAAGSIDLARAVIDGLGDIKGREIIIFPPAVYVAAVARECHGSPVETGIQNMYYRESGAFTGEVSPAMVKDCGCRYILIGHSERRHVFGETDEDVNQKTRAALDNHIDPVICVGELLDERENGLTEKVLRKQITHAFRDIPAAEMEQVIVAYEPVWAIGTGRVATPDIAEDAHRFIRELLEDIYDRSTADTVPILYGGSVKPDNSEGLISMENIDGALVGGASLDSGAFLGIIHSGE